MAKFDPKSVPIRFTRLKLMSQSPEHYRYAIEHQEWKDTAAMRLGRLTHWLVLGSDERIIVWEGRRAGNDWKEFAAENAGKEIVTSKEMAQAQAMAQALRRNRTAMEFLIGDMEDQYNWLVQGRQCTGRVDVRGQRANGRRFVCDLKSTMCAKPGKFLKQARDFGYHAQLAWYGDGMEAAGYEAVDDHFIVAVENKAPFCVSTFQLTPDAVEEGRRMYRAWFDELMVCEQFDRWPGYSAVVEDFDIYRGDEIDPDKFMADLSDSSGEPNEEISE